MLIEVNASAVRQRCEACKAVRSIAVSSLQLGKDNAANVIELPPCPCQSQEWLMRNWEPINPIMADSVADHHRRAVNALAQLLKFLGRTEPVLADTYAAETGDPSDMAALPWALPE